MLLTLLKSQDAQTDRNSDRLTEDALSKFMGTKKTEGQRKKNKREKEKKKTISSVKKRNGI